MSDREQRNSLKVVDVIGADFRRQLTADIVPQISLGVEFRRRFRSDEVVDIGERDRPSESCSDVRTSPLSALNRALSQRCTSAASA